MKHHKRVIALISDTHVGSKYALSPSEIVDDDGNTYNANAGQKQIHEYWRNFIWQCNDLNVDTVIHLGDALHGLNHKEFGANLMFSDLELQKTTCVELLKPLVKNRQFLIISGSGYHESLDSKVHRDIANQLKPHAKSSKYLGMLANIKLIGTKRIINITHGQSSAALYRTTVMDRDGKLVLEAEALGKLPKLDIVVHGHWHSFIHIHLAKQHLIQLPCWMAWEPSRPYLKYYGRMQPDIGGVILLIDAMDRITVWHFLYPTPHIGDFVKHY